MCLQLCAYTRITYYNSGEGSCLLLKTLLSNSKTATFAIQLFDPFKSTTIANAFLLTHFIPGVEQRLNSRVADIKPKWQAEKGNCDWRGI